MKDCTHKLMNLDYWLVCIVNCLLHVSAYSFVSSLPILILETGKPAETMYLLAAFAVGLVLAGPFHAYLGDAFARKHVLIGGAIGMLASLSGLYVATTPLLLEIFMLTLGSSFAFGFTACLTVSIDITVSYRRTAGNMFFALAGGVGLLAGVLISYYALRGPSDLYVLEVATLILAMLLSCKVYVGFRAPEGLGLMSLDRFWLVRGLLPAVNVMAYALGVGILTYILRALPLGVAAHVFMLVISLLFTRILIAYAAHCQRGTANSTCWLPIQLGLILGMIVSSAKGMDPIQGLHWAVGSWAVGLVIMLIGLHCYLRLLRK